jgi:DnaJ family protein C protein 8
MNLANEGLEAKRKEEEVIHRKRKAENDKSWEGAFLFISTPYFCFTSVNEQKVEKIVWIAGDRSPPLARRRRRPR